MEKKEKEFEQNIETAKSFNNLIQTVPSLEPFLGTNEVKIVGNNLRKVKPKEGELLNRAIYEVIVEGNIKGQTLTRSVPVLDKSMISSLELNSSQVLTVVEAGNYKAANGKEYANYNAEWGGKNTNNQTAEKAAAKEVAEA